MIVPKNHESLIEDTWAGRRVLKIERHGNRYIVGQLPTKQGETRRVLANYSLGPSHEYVTGWVEHNYSGGRVDCGSWVVFALEIQEASK
jgi:hypothetical protein